MKHICETEQESFVAEEFNKNICVRIPDTFTAQGTIPGNTRIEETVYSIQIYVIDGAGGNLLSAKTAQNVALVQLANKISRFPEQEQQTDHHKNATQSPPPPSTRQSNPVENNTTSIPRSKIEIINKYSTVFEG